MTSIVVDVFYILDFDRCLGDTTKLQYELEAAVKRKTSISLHQLATARHEVELSGGSFDTAAYVQDILKATPSDTAWDEVCQDMIEHARQKDLLEPSARTFIDSLEKRRAHFGILTYGGIDWQRAKLRASCMEAIPALVTDNVSKGHVISSWQQADGSFVIPKELLQPYDSQLYAKKIVLIDDKVVSFRDIPKGVSGFHVVRSDRKILPSQEGELPSGIVRAEELSKVIELLFSK